ncbi:MAG TPA: 2OG-Fe(II) oxygenase family protein [Steroidobacteraceae bacterium]|jgi:isopenicillin N synthase-like dioxygenase
MQQLIPCINVGALFASDPVAHAATDEAIMAAAVGGGFMLVHAVPDAVPTGRAARAQLLRLFDLPAAATRPLWRQKFAPTHRNVYRGWFPLQKGFTTAKEGIDMGADVAYGPGVVAAADPLREPTPLPPEEVLPGWRAAVAAYYLGMEALANLLMGSIARGLGLPAQFFDRSFERGLSTLRLIRYPVRDDVGVADDCDSPLWVNHAGTRRYLTGVAHVDSGFLTLLAQDGVAGLQARHSGGEWVDVPPQEGTLVVNFGKVLERWTGGRIKATEHRVIGSGRERRSIPFFYEARADAEIAPLPLAGAAEFEPFLYGDYLWATTTQFVEFQGMEQLREPLRPRATARR